jgi:hypothetical protein
MNHRFETGQVLELRSAPRHSNRPAGLCEVISCLPHDKGPLLYRVKSRNESIERVVDEVDLSPSDAVKTAIETPASVFKIAIRRR